MLFARTGSCYSTNTVLLIVFFSYSSQAGMGQLVHYPPNTARSEVAPLPHSVRSTSEPPQKSGSVRGLPAKHFPVRYEVQASKNKAVRRRTGSTHKKNSLGSGTTSGARKKMGLTQILRLSKKMRKKIQKKKISNKIQTLW